MKTKEEMLKLIRESGKAGITLTKLAGTRKRSSAEYKLTKQFLADLESQHLVVKSGSRYYLAGVKGKKTAKKKANYITKEDFEAVVQEIYKDLSALKNEIDRVYEYVDEVFLVTRKKNANKAEGERDFPGEEEMLIAYDNINERENAGDSVSIADFKKELEKMGFSFTEEALNEKLLEMDKNEIIYLQEANNPETLSENERKRGINDKERGFLFYITWIKRP